MCIIKSLLVGVVIYAQPLVDEDVLEPSVLNEVERALSLAPSNEVAFSRASFPVRNLQFNLFGLTNGVSRTEAAIKIVSAQRSDGRWFVGTNDVSAAASAILIWSSK
jgi:hypothetical protein